MTTINKKGRLYREPLDYLHIKLPVDLKNRVQEVARLEYKTVTTLIRDYFVAYLRQNEPAHMRQAAERLKALDETAPRQISAPRQIKPRPAPQPQPVTVQP